MSPATLAYDILCALDDLASRRSGAWVSAADIADYLEVSPVTVRGALTEAAEAGRATELRQRPGLFRLTTHGHDAVSHELFGRD